MEYICNLRNERQFLINRYHRALESFTRLQVRFATVDQKHNDRTIRCKERKMLRYQRGKLHLKLQQVWNDVCSLQLALYEVSQRIDITESWSHSWASDDCRGAWLAHPSSSDTTRPGREQIRISEVSTLRSPPTLLETENIEPEIDATSSPSLPSLCSPGAFSELTDIESPSFHGLLLGGFWGQPGHKHSFTTDWADSQPDEYLTVVAEETGSDTDVTLIDEAELCHDHDSMSSAGAKIKPVHSLRSGVDPAHQFPVEVMTVEIVELQPHAAKLEDALEDVLEDALEDAARSMAIAAEIECS